jgi:hypothetical protein
MDESSDIYRRYSDFKWTEAANAAKGAGKTAYRYSRMPWLQGGDAGLSPLSTLFTKLRASADPVLEGAQAFVLGVDDTAAFGANRRVTEALGMGPFAGHTAAPGDVLRGGEAVGGVAAEGRAGAAPEAMNEALISESPGLHTAGQLAGLFTPFGPAGALFKGLARGEKAVSAALGGKKLAELGAAAPLATKARGLAAGTAAALGSAAVGGAAVTGAREGVEAAADVARTGETERTMGGTTDAMTLSALDPVNLGLGVLGSAATGLAGKGAQTIKESPRYGGNIERLEHSGGRVAFGKGPMGSEAAEKAITEGKKRDILPQDVVAEQVAPKIAEVEKGIARELATANEAAAVGDVTKAKGALEQAKIVKEQGNKAHAEFKEGFYKTREGQRVIPPEETIGLGLKMLRKDHAPAPGGGLEPVGDATCCAPSSRATPTIPPSTRASPPSSASATRCTTRRRSATTPGRRFASTSTTCRSSS